MNVNIKYNIPVRYKQVNYIELIVFCDFLKKLNNYCSKVKKKIYIYMISYGQAKRICDQTKKY